MCILQRQGCFSRAALLLADTSPPPALAAARADNNWQPIGAPDSHVINVDSRGANNNNTFQSLAGAHLLELPVFATDVIAQRNIESTTRNERLHEPSDDENDQEFPYLEGKLLAYLKKWLIQRSKTWCWLNSLFRLHCRHHHHHHSHYSRGNNMGGITGQLERRNSTGMRGRFLSFDTLQQIEEPNWRPHHDEVYEEVDDDDDDEDENRNSTAIRYAKLKELEEEEEDERNKAKLTRVLEVSKLFNMVIVLCHSLFLIKTIDSLITLAKSSSIYTSRASVLTVLGKIHHHQSTSWPTDILSRDKYGKLTNIDNVYYYVLVITLLDFLNNLYWYHSRESLIPIPPANNINSAGQTQAPIRFRSRKISLLRSLFHLITSPRHLFRASYAGLLVAAFPLTGLMGLTVGLLNSFNQVARNAYNIYRVNFYLSAISNRPPANADDGVTIVWEANEKANNKLGWSNWPISLGSSSENFPKLSTFERLQMMSQILGVKLTIFALSLHVDVLQSSTPDRHHQYTTSNLVSFACLLEAFLTMHSYYDKYYTRYLMN